MRAQVEALETELAQLQEQECLLKTTSLHDDNPIIAALTIGLNREATVISSPNSSTVEGEFIQHISPSLLDWSELRDFHPRPQQMQNPLHNDNTSPTAPPAPDIEPPLEEGMAEFAESSQLESQPEPPWWLDTTVLPSTTIEPTVPIDPESLRTNRLVQRWLERRRQRYTQQEQ